MQGVLTKVLKTQWGDDEDEVWITAEPRAKVQAWIFNIPHPAEDFLLCTVNTTE